MLVTPAGVRRIHNFSSHESSDWHLKKDNQRKKVGSDGRGEEALQQSPDESADARDDALLCCDAPTGTTAKSKSL